MGTTTTPTCFQWNHMQTRHRPPHYEVTPCSHPMQPHHAATPCSHTMQPHHAATPCSHTMQPLHAATPCIHTMHPHHAATRPLSGTTTTKFLTTSPHKLPLLTNLQIKNQQKQKKQQPYNIQKSLIRTIKFAM